MYPYREMFYTLNAEVTKTIKLLKDAQKEMLKIYNEHQDINVADEESYSKKISKNKIPTH